MLAFRIGLAEKTVQMALGHAIILCRTDVTGMPPSLPLPNSMPTLFLTICHSVSHIGKADKQKKANLEERLKFSAETLKEVFNEMPNYNVIVPVILEQVKLLLSIMACRIY